MRDRIGRFVIAWRTRVVLPHIRGRLLDVGCGLNELVKAYTGEGTGVDVYQWGDVDLVVAPKRCHRRRRDGNTTFAFLFHIVRRGCAIVHLAHPVN